MKKIFYLLALTLTFNTLLLNAQTGCPNLVTNGDFEAAGGGGFTSSLPLNPACVINTHAIVTNANSKCSFPSLVDHTTGTGKFLLVQGSTAVNVWATTVTVTPNHPYTFSFWASGLPTYATTLAMMVNNVNVNQSITTTTTPGWVKYTFSGITPAGVTSLPIAIKQINFGEAYNYGIDDVVFISCADPPCIACPMGVSGANLIANGSFTGGNVGFTSQLTSPGCGTGTYGVTTNFSLFCGGWQNLGANSVPNFLALDGANNGSVATVLWQSPVALTTNTDYNFSFYWALGFAHALQNFPVSVDIVTQAGIPISNVSANIGMQTIATNLTWTNTCLMWNSGTIPSGNYYVAIRQLSGSLYRDWGIDDICFTKKPPCKADFTFQKIDSCGKVQFTNTSTPATGVTYCWDFDNNLATCESTAQNPMFQFPTCGTYNVGLIITTPNCKDTIKYTVTVTDNIPPVITCRKDTIVIARELPCSKILTGLNYLSVTDNCRLEPTTYAVSGATTVALGQNDVSGLTFNSGISTVTYTARDWCGNTSNCSFKVTVFCDTMRCISCEGNPLSQNLITNGSFTAGNAGFSSGLNYSTGCGTGSYGVITNFNTFCNGWGPLAANSSPNFLALDGNNNGNIPTVLWQSPVTLAAQMDYCFSFYWALGFAHPSQNFPVSIDIVDVNGNVVANASAHVGDVTIANNLTWTNASVMWNSGNLTGNYYIAIRQLTGSLYRDWGIDDICFTKKPPCKADFTFQKIDSCGKVQFTNTSTPATGVTYCWDFDNNLATCESTAQNPMFQFPTCGTYNVGLIITGPNCKDTITHTVTVTDNVLPVARCNPGVGVILDANCQYNVTSAFVDNGSTDNCQIKSLVVNPAIIFGCANTTVTLTVTDWCNNRSTCTMGIQTIETVAPTIVCPPTTTVTCTTDTIPSVTGTATATDNCPGTITFTRSDVVSGNMPCDATIRRTWTATDACGNKSTCTQIIAVRDNVKPTITCPPNVSLQCGATTPSVTGTATATDNCFTPTVSFADIVTGTLPCNTTIRRTWTARDGCGNTATCVQTITVNDNTPPTIVCPQNYTVNTNAGQCYFTGTLTQPTATDNCDQSVDIVCSLLTATSSILISPTTQFPKGVNNISCIAADDCGNASTVCNFTLTVVDNQKPTITCPLSIVVVGTTTPPPASQCKAIVNGLTPTATDNCPMLNVTYVITPVSNGSTGNGLTDASGFNFMGTSTLTYTATDMAGNTASCSSTVTVRCDSCGCGSGGTLSQNLIANGNFALGNVGFTSGLPYDNNTGCVPTGNRYGVRNTLPAFCGGWANTTARTQPNCLILDGSQTGASVLWKNQSPFKLTQGANYCFSFWWTSAYDSIAQPSFPIQVDIVDASGNVVAANIGTQNIAQLPTGVWVNKTINWTANPVVAGTDYYAVVRQLSGGLFRDFAIDDICFTRNTPPPTCSAEFGAQPNGCGKYTFSGFANGTPSYTYTWNFDDPTSTSNIVTGSSTTNILPVVMHQFEVSGPHTVTLTVTDATGCTRTFTTLINVATLPIASITGNLSVCSGQSTTLTASGNGTYSWSPGGSTSAAITVTPAVLANTYSVIVTDVNGCKDTATVTVAIKPIPAFLLPNQTICLGQSATLTAAGGGTYAWTPGGQITASITVTPSVSTTYTCVVTGTNGCTGTNSATVTVNPKPTVTIAGNQTVCQGLSTTLTASGGGTYVWLPSGQTTASINLTPSLSTTYTLITTGTNGCKDTTFVSVKVISCGCPDSVNIVKNGSFESGTPSGTDESIGLATNWERIWPAPYGQSTADYWNTGVQNPMTGIGLPIPTPASQSKFAGFWLHNTTDLSWREGMLSAAFTTPIAQNSGIYDLSLKLACLDNSIAGASLSIFGVPTAAPSALTAGSPLTGNTPTNPNLFAPTAVLLKTYPIPTGCNGTFTSLPFQFNANILPISGIDRIFLTRTDAVSGKAYVAIDDICLRPADTCICGSFTGMYYRPTQGGATLPKVCGDTLPVLCTPQFSPVLSGVYNCIGNCPTSGIMWELRKAPNTPVLQSGLIGSTFSLPLLASYFTTSGNYELTLIPQCGSAICRSCKFTIAAQICDTCKCGIFDKVKIINKQTGSSRSFDCLTKPLLGLTCPPLGQSYVVTGKLVCNPATCKATSLSWKLVKHNTVNVVTSGNQVGPWFSIPLDRTILASINGLYDLMLTGVCGTDTCTCVIPFDIVGCPVVNSCPCDDTFTQNVQAGFSWAWAGQGNCAYSFSPVNLNECDKVAWTITGNTLIFNGTTTSNQVFTQVFPNGIIGTFTITMKVSRTQPDGTICERVFTQTIPINCIVVGGFLCVNNIVGNPGFNQNTTAGIMGETGRTDGWLRQSGTPRLIGGEGCNDPFSLQLVGKCIGVVDGTATPVPIGSRRKGRISLCYKALEADLRPGTQLVVSLSNTPQTGLECGAGCIEIARMPIKTTDGRWGKIGSTFSLNNFSGNKYLNLHLQNDLTYDEPDANSTVLVDFICVEQTDSIFTKTIDFSNDRTSIRIFPNPNPGTFTLELSKPASASMTFRVTDLIGRVVLEKPIEKGSTQQTVSANGLSEGLYFLHIVSEGKVVAIEKFVKQ